MANHCSNAYYVYGVQEELEKFAQFAQTGDCPLDVTKFIPQNPQPGTLDDPGLGWERDVDQVNYEGINLIQYFGHETKWQPAIAIVREMSRMFPKLFFVLWYASWEYSFEGVYKVWAGKEIEFRHDKGYGYGGYLEMEREHFHTEEDWLEHKKIVEEYEQRRRLREIERQEDFEMLKVLPINKNEPDIYEKHAELKERMENKRRWEEGQKRRATEGPKHLKEQTGKDISQDTEISPDISAEEFLAQLEGE